MPDANPNEMVYQVLRAVGVAAALAAGLVLVLGWPWRMPRTGRSTLGWVLGVGLGLLLGCAFLDASPAWPIAEDKDRFLLVLLPAVMLAEGIAAFSPARGPLVWVLRLIVAAGAARILLHGTVYLVDQPVAVEHTWTSSRAWQMLGGMAAALAVVWIALAILAERSPGRSIPLALAIATGGAAVAVMSSGYLTGGQMGLPLAGALLGATVASLLLARGEGLRGSVGVGVVGLFSVVVIGHFFGSLTMTHAVLLFVAPLLCWLPEALPIPGAGGLGRALLRIAVVALPVALTIVQVQRPPQPPAGSGGAPPQPSIQDYMDFGK